MTHDALPAVPAAPAESGRPPIHAGAALVRWVLQRGVLFVLLLTPVTALLLGLLRFVPNRLGYLALLLAFLALPVWVVWRGTASSDPDEPVHHLHRYALYALFPYVVFSVVRIPAFYLFAFPYWAPWYLFGNGATGEPVGFASSLVPGAVLYSLQGCSLAMGFYVLFRRHSLLNATLYFGVFVASLYSFVFPVFLMVGSRPGPSFHVINYWAHLWMGAAAAFTPVLFGRLWPRLNRRSRTLVVAGLAAVWLAPYAFAFGQATLWQPGTEGALERAAFDRVTLQLDGSPTVAGGGQPGYLLTMRLGPREYETYAHVHKALDATAIQVTGRLTDQTGTLAWCTGDTDQLPGTRDVRDPQTYFPVLDRVSYATLTVTCTGPTGPVAPGTTVTIQWTASMILRGERTSQPAQLSGSAQTVVA